MPPVPPPVQEDDTCQGVAPAYLQRRVLHARAAEEELATRGWTVIDLLDAEAVGSLYDYYASHADRGDLNPEGSYNPQFAEFTTMNSRTDFRAGAFETIVRTVTEPLSAHLIDHQPVVANFVNKEPGGGLVPVHQNMSVVDERLHRSVSIWIALVDCSEINGTLEFVEGTHRTFRGRRGTWAYQEFQAVGPESIARHFTPVNIRAGQAIVLDDAIVHYSPPNRSAERRLAIQLVMAPAEVEVRYYEIAQAHGDRVDLDVLAVKPAFFFDFWGGIGDRSHATLLSHETIPWSAYGPDIFEDQAGPPAVGTTAGAAAEPMVAASESQDAGPTTGAPAPSPRTVTGRVTAALRALRRRHRS